MKQLLKGLFASIFVLTMSSVAHADPIGPNCGSCFGNIFTLEFEAITSTDYHITLTINGTGYTGGAGDFVTGVAIKPASQITGGSLISTTAPGTWTFKVGGLNNGNCDGSGSGFECASDGTSALIKGNTYEWVFDATVDDSSKWLLDSLEASIKVNYGPGNGLITSENITLQEGGPPNEIPEPQTLALLALGLLALASVRRKRQ